MARTPLQHVAPFVAAFATFVAPAIGLAEPAAEGSHFYGILEPAVGYAFGTATYEGPVFSGATSTQQRYEAGFRSISFVATVGAGYRLSRSFVVGALALDPSWESRIPGSGLNGYAVLGTEAFGRSPLVGNEGPVIEVAIGYAQFRFAAEPDAFLVQGGIEDTGAFRALPGFAAAAAELSSIARPSPSKIFEISIFVVEGEEISTGASEEARRAFLQQRLLHRVPALSMDEVVRISVSPTVVPIP